MKNIDSAINGQKPTLLEFYASWCYHCQRMMPVLAELKEEMGDRVNIIQIDGDDNPGIMNRFGAKSYPTYILYKEGEEVWRDSGEKPYAELADMIRRFE